MSTLEKKLENNIIEVIDIQIYNCFKNFIYSNKKELEKKQIVIFGAGIRGCMLYTMLLDVNLYNIVFVDNDNEKQHQYINDSKIYDPSYLEDGRENKWVLLPMQQMGEVVKQIEALNYEKDRHYFLLSGRQYDESLSSYQTLSSVLILGDCLMDNILIHEKDKRSLRDIIREKINTDMSVIAEPGVYIRQYYYIILNYMKRNKRLKDIVILLSPEVFHSQYPLFTSGQHIEFMKEVLQKEDVEQQKFFNEVVNRNMQKGSSLFAPSRIKNKRNVDLYRSLYIKLNYMYRANTQSESFQYLQKCIYLCSRHQVRLHMVIEPMNYELANEILGKKFCDKYNEIVEIIKNIASVKEYCFCDLSQLLGKEYFIAISSINEGITIEGREILANHLVELL